MDDKLKQILNKAYSQGASHDQLLSITKTYYNSKNASIASTTPTVKTTSTQLKESSSSPVDIKLSTFFPTSTEKFVSNVSKPPSTPKTTTFGEVLFGDDSNYKQTFGESAAKRELKSKEEKIEIDITDTPKILTPFETYKNKYADKINFNLKPDFDIETGIDKTSGVLIDTWSKIDSNLNKSAEARVKELNKIIENKNNLPYYSDPSKGIKGVSDLITDFNKDDYAEALTRKNEIKDNYQKAIKSLKQQYFDIDAEIDELSFQDENFELEPKDKKRLKYLKETFNRASYLNSEKTINQEYQKKLKQQEDIINGLDASTRNVKTPGINKVINDPTAVLTEIKTDPKKYLLNLTKDYENTLYINQPELKNGIDFKYNKITAGSGLKTELDLSYVGIPFVEEMAFREAYNVNKIDFQNNSYAALQKNKSIAKSMIKEYEKAINETIAYRDKSISDIKKEGKYQINPDWLKEINAQIDLYKEKLNSENLVITEFDNLENKYFKDLKDWNLYTATRDADSETFDAITDIVQPLYLASGAKISGAEDVIQSTSNAIADGLNLMSKEERVARELGLYNKNKYDYITYVPQSIKNTEAFKIHRGKDGSIKWTESFDKRAILREDIKATIESLLLYFTGGAIAEGTGLEAILSKSEFGALRYFSDKIGIIPASIFEMNEIDQQEREAYLRGDYDSINKMFTGGLRKKIVEGATEMIWTPQAKFFKGLEKQPIKQFALKQFFTQSLGKSLVSAEFKPIIKTLTENLIFVPAEESFEELVGNVINDPFEKRQEERNIRFKAVDELTKDKSIETVINTTIGMIPTMLFGVGKGVLGVKLNAAQDYNYELAIHADQYQLYAIDAINKIPEEKLLKLFPQYKSKEEIIERTKKEYTYLKESFKEVAPFSRYLIKSKEKNQIFQYTLELKKLLNTVDPQATEEELSNKDKQVRSLSLKIEALKEKANLNKKENEDDFTDFLHKNIDNFINELDKDSITPSVIEGIKLKLNQFKSIIEGNEKYKDSLEKINKQIEYYNNRLLEIRNETKDLIEKEEEEEEVITTELTRPENVEESIAFMKLHPDKFTSDLIEVYESGTKEESVIISEAQNYYDFLKQTELEGKELQNEFENKLSTLLEIKDPFERRSNLLEYQSELASEGYKELANQLNTHIDKTSDFIKENQLFEKTLKDANGNIVLDANEKPIVKGNFIQVGESLREVEDVSEDGKTIYFKTTDANNNAIEGEKRDSMLVDEAFLQFTKDEAHLKRTELKIEKLTKELEKLNNLPELTPAQEERKKKAQTELEALLPKKEEEVEEEEEEEEYEEKTPVTYEEGPVAYTPLRTIGVDMAKDLANYAANIVWKNTLIWLKNKSKSEGKIPYKDLGYYVSIVKGHLIPFSQQPDDTKTYILKKLNVKDESEINSKEYENLLKNTKVAVITNKEGEFLYFDMEGNPSTKSDARIATFRIPLMEKTKNSRGMYVYNKETGMEVPNQEQMDKSGITVESWNKQVEALNNLRNSDKDIQVLEINGISEGVPSIGKPVPTKISEVEKKTGELKITTKSTGKTSVKIGGIDFTITKPFISKDLIDVFMKIMTEDVLPEGMDKFQAIKDLIGNFIVIGQDTFDASGKLKYKNRITYDKKSDSFYYNGKELSKEELKDILSKTKLNILKSKIDNNGQIQIPIINNEGKIELQTPKNYINYIKENTTIQFNEEAKKETLVSQYLTFGASVEFEEGGKKNPKRPKSNETKEEKVKNLQTEITNLTDEANELELEVINLENQLSDLKDRQEKLNSKKRKTKEEKQELISIGSSISDINEELNYNRFDLLDKKDTINSKSEELAALEGTTKKTEEEMKEKKKESEDTLNITTENKNEVLIDKKFIENEVKVGKTKSLEEIIKELEKSNKDKC